MHHVCCLSLLIALHNRCSLFSIHCQTPALIADHRLQIHAPLHPSKTVFVAQGMPTWCGVLDNYFGSGSFNSLNIPRLCLMHTNTALTMSSNLKQLPQFKSKVCMCVLSLQTPENEVKVCFKSVDRDTQDWIGAESVEVRSANA